MFKRKNNNDTNRVPGAARGRHKTVPANTVDTLKDADPQHEVVGQIELLGTDQKVNLSFEGALWA